jgi:hypothetical protein
LSNPANQSSTWIDANSTNGTLVGSGNYNNTSITKFGLNGKSNGSNIATFTLQMPVTLASNIPPTTLVLRAGAQNNASFKIINIQAQLAVQ